MYERPVDEVGIRVVGCDAEEPAKEKGRCANARPGNLEHGGVPEKAAERFGRGFQGLECGPAHRHGGAAAEVINDPLRMKQDIARYEKTLREKINESA